MPAAAALAPLLAAAPAAAQPQRVLMGMYVVSLSDLDLKAGTYTADFYLWVRSEGRVEGTNFEIMNGRGDPCPLNVATSVGRIRYSVFRCQYEFHRVFDVRSYPLDQHELTIEVEDRVLGQAELVYVPDHPFTQLDTGAALPGWSLGRPRLRVVSHRYSAMSNPDYSTADAPVSRMVLTVPVRRAGGSVYLKSFLVMYLSVGIGLLGSALAAEHVEARLGVGVASIFGVVSSYLVVAESLPETAQFTLADQLHMAAMASVFVSVLVTMVVYRVYVRHGEERAERLDRRLGWATAVLFAAAAWIVTALH